MTDSVEAIIAYHCAPTLKGIKVANLVALPVLSESLQQMVRRYNDIYNRFGLYFAPLCDCEKRRLLLVFRRKLLQAYLQHPLHREFLKTYGYKTDCNIDEYIFYLRQRLQSSCGFPHEIGLFLGYPLADVKAFIEQGGKNYLFCGEWKVYQAPEWAKNLFAQYNWCREQCESEFARCQNLGDLIQYTA